MPNQDIKLGQFFSASEFGQALTDQETQNFFLLCSLVLNYVRNEFGLVTITCGKRSVDKNALVDGVKDSQHLRSEAVDFVCPYSYGKGGMGVVYSYIINTLKFQGEVLWYKKRGHVHIGLPRYNVHPDHLILDK